MPPRLSDYSLADFLHLRPLTQGLKTRRYRKIDEAYFGLPDPDGAAPAIANALARRKMLSTMAFEDPEGLEIHLALIDKYVRRDDHVVADNSRTEAFRQANREVAKASGVHYVALPDNPWTPKNDSRSLGLGLNWLWHNVIKPGRPEAFGFVDDDMFAVAPSDPFAPLVDHAFYGDQRTAGDRWFLWTGFCFFRFADVEHLPLDFGLDWFLRLDVGGANWDTLYRHTSRESLPARPVVEIPAIPGKPKEYAAFEERVGWFHEVGSGFDKHFHDHKRPAMARLLRPHLPADLAARLREKYPDTADSL